MLKFSLEKTLVLHFSIMRKPFKLKDKVYDIIY